jgi:LemA protein
LKNRTLAGCLIAVLLIVVIGAVPILVVYNNLVALDQTVETQWEQVEEAYQAREGFVPTFVQTLRRTADLTESAYGVVTSAQSTIAQVRAMGSGSITTDLRKFAAYQASEDGLTSALSRLMSVAATSPRLKTNETFLTAQAQIERANDGITTARTRYNQAAQAFDAVRTSFPANVIARLWGDRFNPKALFQTQQGSQ